MNSKHLITLALFALVACKKSKPEDPIAARMIATLEKEFPGSHATIDEPGVLNWDVDGGIATKVGLDNTRARCEKGSEQCNEAFDDMVAGARRALSAVDSPRTAAALRPALKEPTWLDTVRKTLNVPKPDGGAPATVPSQPFLGNLSIVWVFDSERGMELATSDHFAKLNLTQEQVASVALANLEKQVGPIPFKLLDDDMPGLYVIDSDDSYEASRLLLPELWKPLGKKVKGSIVAMAPCRNIVLAAGSEDAKAIASMKSIGEQMFANEPYSLSTTLFQLTDAGWKTLP